MLTNEQKACNFDTMKHIERVRNLLNLCISNLLQRGEKHDQSKLDTPEVELFTELTPLLADLEYGSQEYDEAKAKLKPALDHHYAKNGHHPEHYENGINDMDLLDLIEMVVDWKAASERHHTGNLLKSIKINADRFGMSPQLVKIFENTAKLFES